MEYFYALVIFVSCAITFIISFLSDEEIADKDSLVNLCSRTSFLLDNKDVRWVSPKHAKISMVALLDINNVSTSVIEAAIIASNSEWFWNVFASKGIIIRFEHGLELFKKSLIINDNGYKIVLTSDRFNFLEVSSV